MIGLQSLHSEKIKEAYSEWCDAAKDLFAVKTGNEQFYVLKKNGKKHQFHTLQEKIEYLSKKNLKVLAKKEGLSETNQEVVGLRMAEELNYIFANKERLWNLDLEGIKAEAQRCDDNIKRKTRLYYYVYKSLKDPFEDVYKRMQDVMQDVVFQKLDIRTCPYCNRQYTFTLVPKKEGDPNTSPEFDHFYPKSEYPTLAICFYNLIPSCHCCNHGKGAKQLRINPYSYSFMGRFYVTDKSKHVPTGKDVLNIRNKEDIHIIYKGTPEEEEDVRTLGLDQLYSMHSDYVEEIINKANAYNTALNQHLTEAFQGVYQTGQEVFDFVWGRYLETDQLENRSLAKLTRDILEQIGIKR